jgi:hypothetical protein
MSLPLWMTIEPTGSETRVMLTAPTQGTVLKARLPPNPSHGRAAIALMEALTLWFGTSLHAVVDADASDVRRHPERWSSLLGNVDTIGVQVEWVGLPARRCRDSFLSDLGPMPHARRLARFAATGQR